MKWLQLGMELSYFCMVADTLEYACVWKLLIISWVSLMPKQRLSLWKLKIRINLASHTIISYLTKCLNTFSLYTLQSSVEWLYSCRLQVAKKSCYAFEHIFNGGEIKCWVLKCKECWFLMSHGVCKHCACLSKRKDYIDRLRIIIKTMPQLGFIHKSPRDYHIKCGWWNLVTDIHSSMILS